MSLGGYGIPKADKPTARLGARGSIEEPSWWVGLGLRRSNAVITGQGGSDDGVAAADHRPR